MRKCHFELFDDLGSAERMFFENTCLKENLKDLIDSVVVNKLFITFNELILYDISLAKRSRNFREQISYKCKSLDDGDNDICLRYPSKLSSPIQSSLILTKTEVR